MDNDNSNGNKKEPIKTTGQIGSVCLSCLFWPFFFRFFAFTHSIYLSAFSLLE